MFIINTGLAMRDKPYGVGQTGLAIVCAGLAIQGVLLCVCIVQAVLDVIARGALGAGMVWRESDHRCGCADFAMVHEQRL